MAFFESQHYQLRIDEDKGFFDIFPARSDLPRVTGNRLLIEGSFENGSAFNFQTNFRNLANLSNKNKESEKSISYRGIDENSGINWQVTFMFPPGVPLIYWYVNLANHSPSAIFLDKITMLEPGNASVSNISFPTSEKAPDLAFHANGWQSWSYTCTYDADERMRRTKLGMIQEPIIYNPGTPKYRSKGRFSGDFFGVLGERNSRAGLLLGFLSQKNHFGSITADIRRTPQLRLWANGDHARLDPQASISTDWAVIAAFNIDDPDPLGPYLGAVSNAHAITDLPEAPAGWCSWYYYYQKISADIIRDNLNQITDQKDILPLDLVQIDDGFQAEVSDWLEFNSNFSHGVKPLADEIKDAGFTPGLWLAPFIVHPGSRLAAEHPDWLLRSKKGRPVRSGFVWNTFGAALDLTIPEALEYTCKIVDVAAHQWGYPYLKLDFLYAAALEGVYHDPTRTRAQVLRNGMEAIRRSVGEDTVLLGCGAPLGSMLGLVQAMRIGADVSPSWQPKYFGISLPFRNEPHMPSAKTSIQNILSRAPLNRRWWVNDPDCLLVRPDSELNLDEVQALATAIGMTGGSVLLSDNMTELPSERLEIAAALLPPMRERVRVLDWMDAHTPEKLRIDLDGAVGKWHALALFNWEDKSVDRNLKMNDFFLPDEDYWVRSFWDNRIWHVQKGQALYNGNMPPHSALLMAVRPMNSDGPVYLGSSLHISQGLEVKTWKPGKKTLAMGIDAGRQAKTMIDLYLPAPPKKAVQSDKALKWEVLSNNCYRIVFDIDKKDTVKINY